MVYDLQQRQKNQTNSLDLPKLIDPKLLRAARQIYRNYCEAHPSMAERPTGVAINRLTHRGQVLFSKKPIILPEECLVTLSQLEMQIE